MEISTSDSISDIRLGELDINTKTDPLLESLITLPVVFLVFITGLDAAIHVGVDVLVGSTVALLAIPCLVRALRMNYEAANIGEFI